MDDVKENLADTIGPGAVAFADALGNAAVHEIIASAQELLEQGRDVIVEGFFQSSLYSRDFAQLTFMANSVLLHLHADDSALKHRYEQRTLREVRHWIHGDRDKLPSLTPELPTYTAERLHLDVPQLIIDTSQRPVDISATAGLIMRELRPQFTEQSA